MVEKLLPEKDKIYFIEKYTLVHILSGRGSIQVDFKNYFDWQDKAIYLEKGQYIKFLSDEFEVRKIEFPDKANFLNKDIRVLFKHLITLGYIDLMECTECQQFLTDTVFSIDTSDIIDISSRQWYWQNPFHSNKEEYHIIFDAKEVIDAKYKNHLSNNDLSELINHRGYNAHALFKSKVGVTIKSLLGSKRLLESQKDLAFTDKSIKEVAYDLGFKDPAYFNRVFKRELGYSPNEFRKEFAYADQDMFVQDLYEVIQDNHQQMRSLDFYADKMGMPVKTLSKKVKEKLNISLGQLVRRELINTAKLMLKQDMNVNEIAYELAFEEANHFSAFFKKHTGLTPSNYRSKKYK